MPSEKELAIYQGVLRLLEQGADIHALKASDIAAAAGLGKGTLYNYFSSKEEILLSTIRYTMEEHLRHLREAMGQREGVLGNYSQEEILLAFTGVFSALSFRLCAQKEPPDSLVPLCCRMLVRSLAP